MLSGLDPWSRSGGKSCKLNSGKATQLLFLVGWFPWGAGCCMVFCEKCWENPWKQKGLEKNIGERDFKSLNIINTCKVWFQSLIHYVARHIAIILSNSSPRNLMETHDTTVIIILPKDAFRHHRLWLERRFPGAAGASRS